MSRGAVLSLLRNDAQLATIGGAGFVVKAEYSLDQRPTGSAPYVIVCWRTTDFAEEIQANGPKHFELWVHIPISLGSDFGWIDNIIERCDDIFRAVEDGDPVDGGDGWQLEQVGLEGRGLDITDEGPQTICKSAAYYAMSSKTS